MPTSIRAESEKIARETEKMALRVQRHFFNLKSIFKFFYLEKVRPVVPVPARGVEVAGLEIGAAGLLLACSLI